MVCTLYSVKLELKEYDGISSVVPDADFDSANGYSVGYRLLVEDGTSWVCADAAVGAAVWVQDASIDTVLRNSCRNMTGLIVEYTDDHFLTVDGDTLSSGISFSSGGVIDDSFDSMGNIYQGDTIEVCGSKRNDGYYDVLSASSSSITVDPLPVLIGAEEDRILILSSQFPPALSAIAARMVAYDVKFRNVSGLDSESIGSYSYTKSLVTISGMGYPAEVTSGLLSFKRPKVR